MVSAPSASEVTQTKVRPGFCAAMASNTPPISAAMRPSPSGLSLWGRWPVMPTATGQGAKPGAAESAATFMACVLAPLIVPEYWR